MSACEGMAALTLFPLRSLAAFGDLIILTIETTDGNEYHSSPTLKRGRSEPTVQ
jgi:hypothetical protein